MESEMSSLKRRELFEKQLQNLTVLEKDLEERGKAKDFHDFIVKMREVATSEKLEKYLSENCLPFLIVIPETWIPLQIQIEKVQWRIKLWLAGEVIYIYESIPVVYKPESIKNVVSVPEHPYLIFNVEDGRSLQGLSVKEALEKKGANRRPLTVAEGIAIYLQDPRVLEHHAMWLAGSRYVLDEPDEHVPLLQLYKGANPEVYPEMITCKRRDAGLASCSIIEV
jgi:hypothetical protein